MDDRLDFHFDGVTARFWKGDRLGATVGIGTGGAGGGAINPQRGVAQSAAAADLAQDQHAPGIRVDVDCQPPRCPAAIPACQRRHHTDGEHARGGSAAALPAGEHAE